ncbi:hypothetical protein [Maridesulfovibrio sp.]|uniref:hypothetical protein n=2 Tax=Maridesulfovibrio sp. TaxID=2795000 RepID=UPI002AA74257|nr:hypothetical protein [Maridesulfovibrio sp.]
MWGIYSTLMAAFNRKRKCPRCGKVNIIRFENKNKAVKCRKCGKKLPPPGTQVENFQSP